MGGLSVSSASMKHFTPNQTANSGTKSMSFSLFLGDYAKDDTEGNHEGGGASGWKNLRIRKGFE